MKNDPADLEVLETISVILATLMTLVIFEMILMASIQTKP